jgi:hypothetical protein
MIMQGMNHYPAKRSGEMAGEVEKFLSDNNK